MYLEHFGFQCRPFEAGPVNDFFVADAAVQQGLERLRASLTASGTVAVVTGGPGVGKTAMLEEALRPLADRFVIGRCDARHGEPAALLSLVLAEFGIDYRSQDDARCMREFRQFCRDSRQSDRQVLVLLDVNALCSTTARQVLRLALNGGEPAAPPGIVLQGPHRLHQLMNVPGMIQLRQRMSFRHSVKAFSESGTRAYVEHRIGAAGGDASQLIDARAMQTIHRYVNGVPRLINLLMDAAFCEASARAEKQIDMKLLDQVTDALGWKRSADAPDAAAMSVPNTEEQKSPAPVAKPRSTATPAPTPAAPAKPRSTATPAPTAAAPAKPRATGTPAAPAKPKVAVPSAPKPLTATSDAPPAAGIAEDEGEKAKTAEVIKRPATGDTLDFHLFDDFLPDKKPAQEAEKATEAAPEPEAESKDPTGMHIANMQKTGMMRLEDLDDHLAETIFSSDPEMVKAFRTAVGAKPGGD